MGVNMRINELLLTQELETSNISNIKDILSKLNTGDVIKAQVLEASPDELVLRLVDGSVFKASTMVPINVKPGDFVDFSVKEKIDGKLFLETVKSNIPENNIIIDIQKTDAQLIDAGIKPDKISREIASEITKADTDVTGNLVENAIRLAEKFAVIDAKKAGFIVANNINVDIDNVQFVSEFLEGKFDLGSSLIELSDLLTQIDNSDLLKNLARLLSAENITTESSNLNPDITFSNLHFSITESSSNSGTASRNLNLDIAAINSSPDFTDSNLISDVTDRISNPDAAGSNSNLDITGDYPHADIVDNNSRSSIEAENVPAALNTDTDSIISDSNTTIGKLIPDSDTDANKLIPNSDTAKSDAAPAGSLTSDSNAAASSKTSDLDDVSGNTNMNNTAVNSEASLEPEINFGKVSNFSADRRPLEENKQHSEFHNIASTTAKDDTSELKQKIKDIFEDLSVKIKSSGITFRKDANTGIENRIDHSSIIDLYDDISEKLELIKESIKNYNLPVYNKIKLAADNIQQNFKLINDLYGNMMYMQIPLSFNNKAATAGIYIFKRNTRKKKIDPGNATILISINTKNMGQIDSIINIKGKSAAVNFKLENKDMVQFIKDSYSDLYNRMIKKGYKLVEMKCSLRNQDINPLNAKEVADTEVYKGYHSFDLRI